MQYRDARPDDAVALADLGRRAFVAKFGYLYNPQDLAGFLEQAHSAPKVAQEIADPAMRIRLAVAADGRLGGFCKLVLACGWPEYAQVPPADVIELKQLYTDPEITGQGIGTALMGWALDMSRACHKREMQISVWSGNEGAQRFYGRYGFVKVADIHFIVGEQRDEEFLFAGLT